MSMPTFPKKTTSTKGIDTDLFANFLSGVAHSSKEANQDRDLKRLENYLVTSQKLPVGVSLTEIPIAVN